MMGKSAVEIYESNDGSIRLNVQLDGETVWLSQQQMSVLFGRDVSVIRKHVKNVYGEGELEEDSTRAKIALVQMEAGREVERHVDVFNLDVIISVGYRVKSQQGVAFRRWATGILREYVVKGFALDDERLKEGRSRYFRELLQRVRDIRSSERNFYQQVTDIYATSIDYDPRSERTKNFFATVQNKLHYAAHEHTAAEIVFKRLSRDKPFVGMTNFKGDYVTREDVGIAKNYLTEPELQRLNLLVAQYLDYAEFQALEQIPMTMQDWEEALDDQIVRLKRKLLEGKGLVSHRQAIEKAEAEFEAYRAKEMRELESDFDRAIKQLEGDSREQN